VLTAADEVARVSGTLREEVDHFLTAMRADEGERWQWERVSGRGARAALRPRGGAARSAELLDVSRGGALLVCAVHLEAGAEIDVELPGTDRPVAARVVRADGQRLALAFRQDPSSVTRIDAAMTWLSTAPDSSLAA